MIHDEIGKCRKCGASFWRSADEQWKRLCLDCWKASKGSATRHDTRSCTECYQRGLAAGRASAPIGQPVPALDTTRLRELLQLAHPDKHNGSPLAVRVTQWLNEQRRSAQ